MLARSQELVPIYDVLEISYTTNRVELTLVVLRFGIFESGRVRWSVGRMEILKQCLLLERTETSCCRVVLD